MCVVDMSRINGMCLRIWSLMEISISEGLLNFYLFISPLFSIYCLYLPTTLYFTVILPSSFSLYYILTLLLPILFCINSISFLPFNPYFPHKKIVNTLFLPFLWILFFLIILINGFLFLNICFGIFF